MFSGVFAGKSMTATKQKKLLTEMPCELSAVGCQSVNRSVNILQDLLVA